jgi:hypothetical protein
LTALIRHLAYTPGSEFFLAAEFERTVHVYRIGEAKRVATFDTNLDFGGHRLTIHPKIGAFVAGAYIRYGITGYSLQTGSQIWARPDLKKVQVMEVHPNGTDLSCFFENRAALVLDARTGETLHKYHGISKVFFGEGVALWVTSKFNVIGSEIKSGIKFKKAPRGVWRAAFSPDCVLLVPHNGPDEIRSITTGQVIATIEPSKRLNTTQLVTFLKEQELFCRLESIEPRFSTAGLKYQLMLSNLSGDVKAKYPIDDGYECIFIDDGKSLITATGQVVESLTGKTTFRYMFQNDGGSG